MRGTSSLRMMPFFSSKNEAMVIQKCFRHTSLSTHNDTKNFKPPSTGEWIKETWYRHTMEYYSALRKNEIMPFVATWVDLNIMLREETQTRER